MVPLVNFGVGRIVLHLRAMVGDRCVRFHVAGIIRELPWIAAALRLLTRSRSRLIGALLLYLATPIKHHIPATTADARSIATNGEKRHAVHLLQPAGTRVCAGKLLTEFELVWIFIAANITQQQLRQELSLALTDDQLKRDDPLKPFSEVCRNELRALQKAL